MGLGEIQTKKSQIRSSNNYTIEAISNKYGARAINLGCIDDDIDTITDNIQEALKISDIVVTTGGVSVGDFDFVKDVVKDRLGATVLFQGVVIKPGQHIILAKIKNKLILSLPGFAYSSTVTALLYLVPLIYKFQGAKYKPTILRSKLEDRYIKKSKKYELTPCNISIKDRELFVNFQNKREGTSAIMTNMLGDCALVVTKDTDKNRDIGEHIDTYLYKLELDGV